jgi:hypothetical protein
MTHHPALANIDLDELRSSLIPFGLTIAEYEAALVKFEARAAEVVAAMPKCDICGRPVTVGQGRAHFLCLGDAAAWRRPKPDKEDHDD